MQRLNLNIVFIITALIYFCTTVELYSQTYSQHGMVVSSSRPASEIGVRILKQGGNAVDASVATALALAVTLPSAGNLGGGGFMVYYNQKNGVTTFDFREKAPLLSTATMYLDNNGKIIDETNHKGIRAIGVPGTVAGLYKAHKRFGKLPWKKVVQPAIDLAQNGFPMTWTLYNEAQWLRSQSKPGEFIYHYFDDGSGNITPFGQIWRQPELANTLRLIRDYGTDGFYKGEVARKITSFMKKEGGIITQDDLSNYNAVERKPIRGTFRDFQIYSMGPPSSGGVALVQLLNMLETVSVDSIPFNSTNYVHFMSEIMRRAFSDRAKYLGDPDFNQNIPVDFLTSKEHAKQLLSDLNWRYASISDTSSTIPIRESDHTTHFSIIDKEGNAVSLTYTLEDWYGSKIGIPELGFIFNNEMGDFNPVPGVTNRNGQIGTQANTIAPGKRMLSSMTPSIIVKNNKAFMVIGSPGGRTIINTVFQSVANVILYHMPLRQAIEVMKIHHQWLPDEIVFEENLMSPDTQKSLKRMGHHLKPVPQLGSLMGIIYDPEKNIFIGASDASAPDGAAIGY